MKTTAAADRRSMNDGPAETGVVAASEAGVEVVMNAKLPTGDFTSVTKTGTAGETRVAVALLCQPADTLNEISPTVGA